MEFRKEALARTNTVEALDLPVRLTRPRGWIVLAALAAVVIGGGSWMYAGSLPRTVTGRGLLTSAQGSFGIQSAVTGQVTAVPVKRGSVVRKGETVAVLSDDGRSVAVRSPARGRIFSLSARVGQVVELGNTLAVAERTGTDDDHVVAVLYLSAATAASVRPGGAVDLSVESAPAVPFGVLRGRITSVEQFASKSQDVADFLGDADLAQTLTAGASVRKVVVDLNRSPDTVSGYAWSTRAGPPFKIGTRTVVTGAVEQPDVRPIDWIIPR